MSKPVLEFLEVTKRYGDFTAVDRVSFKEGIELYSRGYGSVALRTDVDQSFLSQGNIPKPGVKYFDDTEGSWIVTGRHENREKVWKLLKPR